MVGPGDPGAVSQPCCSYGCITVPSSAPSPSHHSDTHRAPKRGFLGVISKVTDTNAGFCSAAAAERSSSSRATVRTTAPASATRPPHPSTEQPGCGQGSAASSPQPQGTTRGAQRDRPEPQHAAYGISLPCSPRRAGSCWRFPHLKPPTALGQTVLMRSSRCQKPPGEQKGLRDSSPAKLLP